MPKPTPLQHTHHYHIYNRGNNRGDIFIEERNYRHFLRLYAKHTATSRWQTPTPTACSAITFTCWCA